MQLRRFGLLLALAGCLSADVTVRYKMDFKSPLSAMIPADAMSKITAFLSPNMTMRVKGTRSSSEFAGMTALADSATRQMTLIDAAGKQYTVADSDAFSGALAKSVPSAATANMPTMPKPTIESRDTGQTATIQGIAAEEHLLTITIDAPPIPSLPPGPFMKMVMHVWTSKATESDRVPALKELAAYTKAAVAGMNPLTGLQKALGSLPSLGVDTASAIQKLTSDHGVVMRTQVEVFLPGLAGLMQMAPAGANPLGGNFDPASALATVNQELVELSTDSVPERVFQVPADFAKIPMDEFVKQWMNRLQGAAN